MKKLFIAVLAFFACYSLAIAEIYEYEASGTINSTDSRGIGTDADGKILTGERFTVRFSIDTEEALATTHTEPGHEEAVYFQTYPMSLTFSGGLSINAIPIPNAEWWDSTVSRYIAQEPNYPQRAHFQFIASSGADFQLNQEIQSDHIQFQILFAEYSEPFEFTTIELGPLPSLLDLNRGEFILAFDDFAGPGIDARTNYFGSFDSLILLTNGKKKQEKQLICHVGNEAGPNGETYLDEPDCIPNELNDYFCPDAGKIDLIVVAEKAAAKHLGNPSHSWDGISDYLPEDVGASGEGTEDSDGNGIDDGCEAPQSCPCWAEEDLSAVSEINLDRCDLEFYPTSATITGWFETPGIYVHFAAGNELDYGVCVKQGLDVPYVLMMDLTAEEAESCVEQIFNRCTEISSTD